MITERGWAEIVADAAIYLKLGQVEHYLATGAAGYPWEFAYSCEPSGSHRIDISTGVRFRADHPSGLKFTWCIDIEPYSANGKGYYEIDVNACRDVIRNLPPTVKAQFQSYLTDCAKAVKVSADKYREIADREERTAKTLAEI